MDLSEDTSGCCSVWTTHLLEQTMSYSETNLANKRS